jgi:hypothetical protein
VYAGREVARALAKDSLEPEDCNDDLKGLTADQLERLEQQVKHFSSVYDEVGKVGPGWAHQGVGWLWVATCVTSVQGSCASAASKHATSCAAVMQCLQQQCW